MARATKTSARKLTRDHRFKMAVFVRDRLRSPGLRTVEAAARQALIDALYGAATAIPEAEIAVLRKHRCADGVIGFRLPTEITVAEGEAREFERPDGKKVEFKPKTRTLRQPRDDDAELPRFSTWHKATLIQAERPKEIAGRCEIRLPATVYLPSTHSCPQNDFVAFMRAAKDSLHGLTIDSLRSHWLTPAILPAIQAYYLAAEKRILEERRLIVTGIKVIAQCDTYEQVVEFLPELKEIEATLFSPPPIVPSLSLVVLSDEDKAALCANLTERGVSATACAA